MKLGHINCVCVAREKYILESIREEVFVIIRSLKAYNQEMCKLVCVRMRMTQSENSNPFMFSEGRFGDTTPGLVRIRRSCQDNWCRSTDMDAREL